MITSWLTNFWDYGVVFLLILTIVVFVHELGHYLVARWCGVKVETFSIGFGPELFGWYNKAGTRWRISLLPLGGYVKMFGDAGEASTPDTTREYSAAEKAVAFQFKTVWQRMAIVIAGPASNFIFGIIALAILLAVYGEPRNAPVIDQVQEGSAAAEVGLQKGDRITEIAGTPVKTWQDLQRIVQMSVGEPISLGVQRDQQHLDLVAHPQIKEITDLFGNVHKTPLLGIMPDPSATELVRFNNPATALLEATEQTYDMVGGTLKGIGQMLTGQRDSSEVGGPLRIAKGAGAAAKIGLGGVAYYIILLSINLGLFNCFPVPLLDGGHLMFYAIEAVRGRPLGVRAQEYGFRLGLFLVFALMLFTTRNDLLDLRVWDFIKRVVS
jgi:regulator of sigma E protease